MAASESNVQSRVRMRASELLMRLWRNNRGAFKDASGQWVRYGLANDTKDLGRRLRAHDLIGWRRVVITPDMVGKAIAQFVSVECKREDWRPPEPGTEEHEHYAGQAAWRDLVNKEGGYSVIITDPSQLG